MSLLGWGIACLDELADNGNAVLLEGAPQRGARLGSDHARCVARRPAPTLLRETLGEPRAPGVDPPPTGPPDLERIAAVGRESGIHLLLPAEAGG